jgi:ABC-type multidrug transport system fused ATPase/permease subunit
MCLTAKTYMLSHCFSLWDSVDVVSQEPGILSLSIMGNTRYGRLNATDGSVEGACKAAAVHDN